MDGQAEHLKRLTNRKQREWLKKTQEGQTTLHGKYRRTEDQAVLAARRKVNEDRREARAKMALAEEPQKKKQRQTTIAWGNIERIAAEAASGQLAASLQVAAAGGGRPRKAAEGKEQRPITDWTTVQEKTKQRHAKRQTKGKGSAGLRRSSRRKEADKNSGVGAQARDRNGVAALRRSTMREKD